MLHLLNKLPKSILTSRKISQKTFCLSRWYIARLFLTPKPFCTFNNPRDVKFYFRDVSSVVDLCGWRAMVLFIWFIRAKWTAFISMLFLGSFRSAVPVSKIASHIFYYTFYANLLNQHDFVVVGLHFHCGKRDVCWRGYMQNVLEQMMRKTEHFQSWR